MDSILNHRESASCSFCEKDVSPMILRLQKRSSAAHWKKHGKCCVSCEAEEYNKSKWIIYGRKYNSSADGYSLIPTLSDPNKYIRVGPGSDLITKNIAKKSDLRYKQLILGGKILAALGVLSGISFFYTEIIYMVLIAGSLIVIGIILCRVGVWKKCRLKASSKI